MTGISLKTRITLAVSILVVSIISVTSFFSLRYFEKHLKETLSSQQFTLVSVLADDFDYKITDSHNLIIDTARKISPSIISDRLRARQILDQEIELLNTFDNGICIFDRAGAMIAEAPMNTGRAGGDFSYGRS